jgi:hypothetical protein
LSVDCAKIRVIAVSTFGATGFLLEPLRRDCTRTTVVASPKGVRTMLGSRLGVPIIVIDDVSTFAGTLST